MPKTLQGVNRGSFKNAVDIVQPGERRDAANSIENPIRALLDNLMFLLEQQAELSRSISNHTHDIATAARDGFFSKEDKQTLDALVTALNNHGHGVATLQADGFMSMSDRDKFNTIERGAHTVTRARAEAALGIVRGEFTLPESAFSAGQTKSYAINADGTKYDAPIVTSETLKSNDFIMAYHVEGNAIDVRIRNVSSSSKTFPGGTVRYLVLNGPSA